MTRKLIAETRIRYKDFTYDAGNSFLCDDRDVSDLIRDKVARPYPEPSPEVLAKIEASNEQIEISHQRNYPKSGKIKSVQFGKVSIITAIKDNIGYLKDCVESVYKNTDSDFEYIIIDNGSGPEVKEYLIKISSMFDNIFIVTNEENMGYAYACNQGLKLARQEFICMLDADTYVSPGWLKKLLKTFRRYPDCGVAVPSQAANRGAVYIPFVLKNRSNIQEELKMLSESLPEDYEEKQIFQIYGFCHLVKKEVYENIGCYDWKRYRGMAGNETDLFWRAGLKGFKLYWTKSAYVHHFHNKIKISLGMSPAEMVEKGHQQFYERQKHPENYYIENDAVIKSNIDLAYRYNETFNNLKKYFNE